MVEESNNDCRDVVLRRSPTGSRIIFSGGGTLGSVTPLLAMAEALPTGSEVFWIGTLGGPERGVVEKTGIKFYTINAGKWRRYWDPRNFVDPFRVISGFAQARRLLKKLSPNVVVSAGGFVATPVIWAAQTLRIPTIVHQQDVRVGLANKLTAPLATKVTAAWPETKKVGWRRPEIVGNPGRKGTLQGVAEQARVKWNIPQDKPVLLVMGGGTGARAINELVASSIDQITQFCSVIHITGPDRSTEPKVQSLALDKYNKYVSLPFLDLSDLADAYAVADLVVSRAGMGAIAELAALGKAVVLIPIPKSPQEANARALRTRHAGLVLDQDRLDGARFFGTIREIMQSSVRNHLAEAMGKVFPSEANEKFASLILSLCRK